MEKKYYSLIDITPCDVDMKKMWSSFENDHKEWTDEDYRSFTWSGNGFPTLPTLEFFEGGTVLLLTAAQKDELRELVKKGGFCEHVESPFGESDYTLLDIDEVYVVD